MIIDDSLKKELLHIARETIKSVTSKKLLPEFSSDDPVLNKECGAFVTLRKNKELRGCIGYIQAFKPLLETITDMAQAAALRDPRFTPVSFNEVDDLTIEISVLTPLEKVSDVEEIEIGRHGLLIEKFPNSGVLLPQVPVEYNWDRDMFLQQTCRKAGLNLDEWKKSGYNYI